MAFDYKKEYKEFYLPPKQPEIVTIPSMNFVAVRGKGNPNEECGEYQHAIQLLYGIAYTLKMSYKGNYHIKGFFEYVVPPLEGFWWQEGVEGVDYSDKSTFEWIAIIRIPEFITVNDLEWAKIEAGKKKKMDFSQVEFYSYHEGSCVQCMHIGPYDEEPATIERMHEYVKKQGYEIEITNTRFHHEIYLSDPRKCSPQKQKTVIRHPVRKVD